MPWRDDPSPYKVWISEVMLQQTQVVTVIPYFDRFVRAFPTVRRLAEADLQDVLKAWEGLGYYARARNLHRAAKTVLTRHGGAVPGDAGTLRRLPGIGDYTAAAVASISAGAPIPAVDGNILRVFSRFWGSRRDIAKPQTRQWLARRLTPIIAGTDPSLFNQACMELGALVCRPHNPECARCPLQRDCMARARGWQARLPVKSRPAKGPHYDVAAAVIRRRDGRILIAQRPPDHMLGGLWEFPGGKREAGETLEQALRREIEEETSLIVEVGAPVCSVKHAYSHFRITLHAFECRPVRGRARAHEHAALRWVRPSELTAFPFPTADRKILETLPCHGHSVPDDRMAAKSLKEIASIPSSVRRGGPSG
jgi:A/G-specific adenine glycosylase